MPTAPPVKPTISLPTPFSAAALPGPDPRRRHALAWLAASAALGMTGCREPQGALRVGSIPFPGYELMHLAQAQGRLDTRQVRLIEMRASTDTLQALIVGQLEGAALTLDEFIMARSDGLKLRIVAVLDESAGADVVVSRRPVARLADLAGRRIGVEAGAVGGLMLAALLEAAGLGPSDVQRVPVTLVSAERAFEQAQLDAVVTAEPYASRLEARGGVRIFDSRAIPGRIIDVLAVQAGAIQQQGASVQALVNAHFDGLRMLQADPTGTAQRMAQRLGIATPELASAFGGLKLPDRAENVRLLGQGALLDSARALQALMVKQELLPNSGAVQADWIEPRFVAG